MTIKDQEFDRFSFGRCSLPSYGPLPVMRPHSGRRNQPIAWQGAFETNSRYKVASSASAGTSEKTQTLGQSQQTLGARPDHRLGALRALGTRHSRKAVVNKLPILRPVTLRGKSSSLDKAIHFALSWTWPATNSAS